MEVKLLGSASTLERITALAGRYYYSQVQAVESSPGAWAVHNSKGAIDGVRIIRKGARYRFERIG